MSKEKKIKEIIEEVCKINNANIYNLKISSTPEGKKIILFISIENGVKLKDCEVVSRMIQDELDFEGFSDRNYLLEVSSPGLERPLEKYDHFTGAIGEEVKIQYRNKRGKKRRIQGKLVKVDMEKITIRKKKGKEYFSNNILFEDIIKGKTVFI